MRKMGTIDLEVLDLAVRENGTFDENSLENSSLKRLGVGKILDSLASLKDRKMITLNGDGSFSITEMARNILWSKDVPAWANILRLLQVRSCKMDEITGILRIPEGVATSEVDRLRKSQFVLMSPQRVDDRIVKVYEIMQEGIDEIDRTETAGFADTGPGSGTGQGEIHKMIDDISREVRGLEIGQDKRDKIIDKLKALQARLDV